MPFPVRWDPFFRPWMSLQDVYHYATQHYEFHRAQALVRPAAASWAARLTAPPHPSRTVERRTVGYRFVNEVPTVEQHGALAVAVGWADSFRWEAMPASLAGSVCGVMAYAESGQPVAMGRVVGDGAFYFYVQDVAVHGPPASGTRARDHAPAPRPGRGTGRR